MVVVISEVSGKYIRYVEAFTMSGFTREVVLTVLAECLYNWFHLVAPHFKQAVLRPAHAAPEGPAI